MGIYGYVGPRPLSQMLLRGLEQLEYRGYDSAGVALKLRTQAIVVERAVGRVEQLRQRLQRSPVADIADGLGLAHTRWATHGPPLERNAHPHVDCRHDLAVVHNSIIENHDELRHRLAAMGSSSAQDTDTEVVSHLIETFYDGDLRAALQRAIAEAARLVRAGRHSPGGCPRRSSWPEPGSPLTIGIGEQEAFVASDVAPMLEYTRRIMYLDDGDLAVVQRGEVRV